MKLLPCSLLDYVNQRVHDQPYHFVVFTSMVLVILYILVVKRAYDPAKRFVKVAMSGSAINCAEYVVLQWIWHPRRQRFNRARKARVDR